MSSNLIDVTVVFTGGVNDNNQLITDNYNQIMAGLAQAANVAMNAIIVKSMKYGSVTVNYLITTSSQNL